MNGSSNNTPRPLRRFAFGLSRQVTIAVGVVAQLAAPTLAHPDDARPGQYVTIGYTLSDETDIDAGGAGTLAGKETRIVAGLLPTGPATRGFDLGLDYQYTRYTYENVDSRNRDLHRLQLPVGLHKSVSRWAIDAFVAPGIATSSNVQKDPLEQASSDDYFATARVEAAYAANSGSAWLAGLAWDRSFGRPRVYPVIGWNYAPSARLAARLAFPDPELRFAATARQTLRFRLYPAGFEWHVLDDDLVTEFDYHVEAWRAEAWWSMEPVRSVYVDVSVGYEFDRRHELSDRAGTRVAGDVDNAVVLTVGLRWRNGPPAPTNRVARSSAP